MKKPLFIHGPVSDLQDILNLARSEGSKVLKVDSKQVSVKPYCQPFENGYVVVVDVGCNEASEVVGGRKTEPTK